MLPIIVCVCPFFLLTRKLIQFTLHCPCSLSTSHCCPPPPFGIACMPGWLKELVRLSSQGFHLVILPLGIHNTLLPPEAACLDTDSLKETSDCHFNSHSLASLLSFLHLLPTPTPFLSTKFLLILFYVVFLPLPPRVSPPSVFFLGSLIVCAFSNCVREGPVSCYGC